MGERLLGRADPLVQQPSLVATKIATIDRLHGQHFVFALPLPVRKLGSEVAQQFGPVQRSVFDGRYVDVAIEFQFCEVKASLGDGKGARVAKTSGAVLG